MPYRFLPNPFHFSLFISPFDAVYFENMTETFNKIKTQEKDTTGLCNFNDVLETSVCNNVSLSCTYESLSFSESKRWRWREINRKSHQYFKLPFSCSDKLMGEKIVSYILLAHNHIYTILLN
jgi:hypothetical protein